MRRKELLKNAKKEFVKVVSILQSYGLCAQDCRINAVNVKKGDKRETILNISQKGELSDKIVNIFGPQQEKDMVSVSLLNNEGFDIEGFISTCCHGKGRSRGDRQFFFVQNRPCDLPGGVKAINEVYHQYNRHQYPFFVFKITSKTKGSIDVNLTPDKRKVLLEKETSLWQALKEKLKTIFDAIAPPVVMTSNNFSLMPTIKSTTKVLPEPKVKTLDIHIPSSCNEKEVAAKSETPKLDRKKKQLVECRYDELDERKNAQRRIQVVSFSMSGLKQSLAPSDILIFNIILIGKTLL